MAENKKISDEINTKYFRVQCTEKGYVRLGERGDFGIFVLSYKEALKLSQAIQAKAHELRELAIVDDEGNLVE